MNVRRPKIIFAAIGTAAIGALLVGAWLQRLNDPQGESSAVCDVFELPSVSSGSGMAVSGHTTYCTTLGTDVGTYIHVHRDNEHPNRSTLAFRFSPAGDAEPKIEWTTPSSVLITVAHVSQVTKMRAEIEGVKVQYVIGKQDYPPSLDAAQVQ